MEIKKTIRKLIPEKLKNFISYSEEQEYQRISYSQYGEDLIINDLLNKEIGFYIDVGSFHPIKSSNTYYFYKKGWSGINIEPRSGSKELFDQYRPRDINLEIGVAETEERLMYNAYSEGRLNHFRKAKSDWDNLRTEYYINVKPLEVLLDEFLPYPFNIDFISIDVEGMELTVLKSLNFERFRPEVVVVEDHSFSFQEKSNVYSFLTARSYQLKAVGFNSLFFKRRE